MHGYHKQNCALCNDKHAGAQKLISDQQHCCQTGKWKEVLQRKSVWKIIRSEDQQGSNYADQQCYFHFGSFCHDAPLFCLIWNDFQIWKFIFQDKFSKIDGSCLGSDKLPVTIYLKWYFAIISSTANLSCWRKQCFASPSTGVLLPVKCRSSCGTAPFVW